MISLSKDDRRKLELAGLIKPAVVEPLFVGSFRSTPGPKDGCKYVSPYRRRDRRTGK